VTWFVGTIIIPEVRKGPRCHPAIAAWWPSVEGAAATDFLSFIMLKLFSRSPVMLQ